MTKTLRVQAKPRKNFIDLEGTHVILVEFVMKKHSNRGYIQVHCIRLMTRATSENDDLKIAFAQVGGLQVILAAMDSFDTTWHTQSHGLAAMTNMICDNDSSAKTLVNDLNGGVAILKAMDVFSDNEDVAMRGCRAIKCLASPFGRFEKAHF